MRSGPLRTRITIERPTTTLNDFGQENEDDTTTVVATRWAQVRALNGKELSIAQQTNAQITHEVRMRYDASLNLSSKDRLTFSGRTLEIATPPVSDDRNREYVFQCAEAV